MHVTQPFYTQCLCVNHAESRTSENFKGTLSFFFSGGKEEKGKGNFSSELKFKTFKNDKKLF